MSRLNSQIQVASDWSKLRHQVHLAVVEADFLLKHCFCVQNSASQSFGKMHQMVQICGDLYIHSCQCKIEAQVFALWCG